MRTKGTNATHAVKEDQSPVTIHETATHIVARRPVKSGEIIEPLVQEYGEKRRKLIVSFIEFLDRNEKAWQLDRPIDRREAVADLLESLEE